MSLNRVDAVLGKCDIHGPALHDKNTNVCRWCTSGEPTAKSDSPPASEEFTAMRRANEDHQQRMIAREMEL